MANKWPKGIVNSVIKILRREFRNNYHKPLKKHLKENLGKGYSEEEIKDKLVKQGWEENAVEKVLREEKEISVKVKLSERT